MINPKNIIKSVFIDGESLPQWRENRLSKCSTCVYNSKNVENKNIFRKGYQAIGGAHCTVCNCILENKTKVAEEECPKGFWKKENVEQVGNKIQVEVAIEEIVTLSNVNDIVVLDYGIIKYKSNSAINVQLVTEKYTTNSISSSCGCTVPKLKENDRGYILNITYDTKRLGAFEKNVTIQFINNIDNKLERENLTVKIKGTVSNT